MPSTARLRINARKLERQLTCLESQVTGFHVVDFYDDLMEEANTLQHSIDQLTNANVLDDELIRDIQAALEFSSIRRAYLTSNSSIKRQESYFASKS